MDFKKAVQRELDEKYLYVLNTNINSVVPKERIEKSHSYKERCDEYHKRLVDEQKEYNKSLSEIRKRNEARVLKERMEQERSRKRRKKLIKVVAGFCVLLVFVICALVFLNYHFRTFQYEYELLDDGTYAVIGISKGKYAEKVTIPATHDGKNVSTIQAGVFKENLQIKEVVAPASLKRIEAYAFDGCKNLTKLDLGGVEEIGEEAFANCGLQEIIIPNQVRKIGNLAFSNCISLEKIAFNAVECEDLTSSANIFKGSGEAGLKVEIGKEVRRVPAYLLTQTHKEWNRSNEYAYREMYDRYVASVHASANFSGNSNVNVMSFEKWVLSKYSYSVYSNVNVISIIFESGSQCRELGTRAFYKTMIETIAFPQSLTIIEELVVGGCEKLTEIKFEDSQNWYPDSDESVRMDFADEYGNVKILLKQYAQCKIKKSK